MDRKSVLIGVDDTVTTTEHTRFGCLNESRRVHQEHTIEQFRKRASRVHDELDSKLLDVIDAYESRLAEMEDELSQSQRRGYNDDVIARYEQKLQDSDYQLYEKDRKIQSLEERIDVLNLDLEGRPKISDFRALQRRIRYLEKLLASRKISSFGFIKPNANNSNPVKRRRLKPPAGNLPHDLCQRYLQELSNVLEVDHPNNLVSAVWRYKELVTESIVYFEFAKDVMKLVKSTIGEEVSLDNVLSALHSWHDIIISEKKGELVLKNEKRDAVLKHIQDLFNENDVTHLYLRVNQCHSRLNELNNVTNSLKHILTLPETASSLMIIDAVEVLKASLQENLCTILNSDDIDTVVRKLEEHTVLMPKYRDITNKVLDLLNVDRLDDIIPSLQRIIPSSK